MSLIAVIDDDVYIGDMLERLLTKNGYQVIRAYSGTEAEMMLSGDKTGRDFAGSYASGAFR